MKKSKLDLVTRVWVAILGLCALIAGAMLLAATPFGLVGEVMIPPSVWWTIGLKVIGSGATLLGFTALFGAVDPSVPINSTQAVATAV